MNHNKQMKKLLLSIFFAFFLCNLFAQNKMVHIEYEVYYNTEKPNYQYFNLFFDLDKNKSLYIENNERNENNESTTSMENNRITLILKSKNKVYNYFDFKKDSLFSFKNVWREDFIIEENTPILKWKLINEVKQLDKYTLHKATCYFRGRNYTAWYSLDYPWKVGPWKFHGLPGVIFEINDDEKRYNWKLKTINLTENNEKIWAVDFHKVSRINLKQYVDKQYVTGPKKFEERLDARLPRGTNISNKEGIKVSRNGIETKFEWEQ